MAEEGDYFSNIAQYRDTASQQMDRYRENAIEKYLKGQGRVGEKIGQIQKAGAGITALGMASKSISDHLPSTSFQGVGGFGERASSINEVIEQSSLKRHVATLNPLEDYGGQINFEPAIGDGLGLGNSVPQRATITSQFENPLFSKNPEPIRPPPEVETAPAPAPVVAEPVAEPRIVARTYVGDNPFMSPSATAQTAEARPEPVRTGARGAGSGEPEVPSLADYYATPYPDDVPRPKPIRTGRAGGGSTLPEGYPGVARTNQPVRAVQEAVAVPEEAETSIDEAAERARGILRSADGGQRVGQTQILPQARGGQAPAELRPPADPSFALREADPFARGASARQTATATASEITEAPRTAVSGLAERATTAVSGAEEQVGGLIGRTTASDIAEKSVGDIIGQGAKALMGEEAIGGIVDLGLIGGAGEAVGAGLLLGGLAYELVKGKEIERSANDAPETRQGTTFGGGNLNMDDSGGGRSGFAGGVV